MYIQRNFNVRDKNILCIVELLEKSARGPLGDWRRNKCAALGFGARIMQALCALSLSRERGSGRSLARLSAGSMQEGGSFEVAAR